MSDSSTVNPFIGERAFQHQPVLPDVEKQEPLGSGIVTNLLGHGGMANVYEIWIPKLEVYRAVKIIKPDCTKDALDRFQTEIKILAKLAHANIIHIHSVGEWKGLPYIEMDKIDGWTLTDLIHEKGALPLEVCTSVAVLTCRAMAFAHNHKFQIYGKTYHGVVHRDLKPGNIMLTRTGELVLMDFGVARPAGVSFHTIDGAVVGTIQYMSPELMAGKRLDFRTDIYALGATVYEVLTSVNPFPEQNFSRLVNLKQKNKYRNLSEFKIKIPRALKMIVHKCMNYDPEKRYNTTKNLVEVFEKVHQKVSSEKPEIILKKYVKSLKPGKKYIPETRFYISTQLLGVTIGSVAAAIMIFWSITNMISSSKEKKAELMAFRSAEITKKVSNNKEKVSYENEEKVSKNSASKKSVNNKGSLDSKTVKDVAPKAKSKSNKVIENKNPKKTSVSREEILELKYGTTNLHKILMGEYNSKNYNSALKIYDKISLRDLTTRDKIIKMRILQATNNYRELTRFLSGGVVNDAEFFLARGINALNSNALRAAESNLKKSLSAPKEIIDYNTLKRQVFYYKAKLASKRFDNSPNEDTYKQALEEWRNFGELYSNDRNNAKFKEYRKEARRLGIKYQSL